MKEKQIKIGMYVKAKDNHYGCTAKKYKYVGRVLNIIGENRIKLETVKTKERCYSKIYNVYLKDFWKHFKEINKSEIDICYENDKDNIFNTFNI